MNRRRLVLIGFAGLLVTPSQGAQIVPADVAALEAAFGGPSQAGFGSAVFYKQVGGRARLEQEALATYRHFTGELWDRWGETAWMGQWRLVHERKDHRGIIAELTTLADQQARQSAMTMLDGHDDPETAKAALAQAFDDPSVAELLVHAIGDGNAMSGLLTSARLQNGDGRFLIFLMD